MNYIYHSRHTQWLIKHIFCRRRNTKNTLHSRAVVCNDLASTLLLFSTRMNRLIPEDSIPESLWKPKNDTLVLPSSLKDCWKSVLEQRNLLQQALTERGDNEIGGIDEEATNKHYSFRFNGSCARFQLTFLDPKDDLKEVSNAFVKSLAGNSVFIADIPSGTGAASLSLLTNIAQLREEKLLPKLPLEVKILAGEISPHAIKIFNDSLKIVSPYLQEHSIYVEVDIVQWDIQDDYSNTDLIKKITIASQHSKSKILLITNFNGYLDNNGVWNKVQHRFEEIFRYFSGESTVAIWLEPLKNNVTRQFWPNVLKWFQKKLKRLINNDKELEYESSSARYEHGLIDSSPRVNVAVVKFNTERN